MPTRKADAEWEGSLEDGKGTMKLGGGAYEGPYSFASRFEEGSGTNPEELIGAAHAGCYSMALSGALGKAGHNPTRVSTTAEVELEKGDEGFTITRVLLRTRAEVPDLDEGEFQELAEEAKNNCPVSRLLTGAEIALDAALA